jgi:hypothetical protein
MQIRYVQSLIAAFLLLAVIWPVNCHAEKGIFTVLGAGSRVTCAQWKWMRDRQGEDPDQLVAKTQQWLVGYISGIVYVTELNRVLDGATVDSISKWMDNYCLAHPDTILAGAADYFVHSNK